MPVRSRARKQIVVIQCVTRTRAECLGATFVTGAVETALGMEVSAGSCADPSIAILASVGLRLAPIGWEPSYHSLNTVTDKSRRGNQSELIPLGESDMRNGWAAVGGGHEARQSLRPAARWRRGPNTELSPGDEQAGNYRNLYRLQICVRCWIS